jgi:demethylmenaquinone methyltransferase/2-methoxy-6-polyprenyl-1,4-benzoquinol methylase
MLALSLALPFAVPFSDDHLRREIERIARLFSRNAAAYGYLSDSIRTFPPPREFGRMMTAAGLRDVVYHGLTFGAAYVHVGRAPARASGGG